MKKPIIWVLITLAPVAVLKYCGFPNNLCGPDQINEILSGNKKWKAAIFVIDCGATTTSSTQVSIFPADKEQEKGARGNVLVFNGNYNENGEEGPFLHWEGDSALSIKYSPRLMVLWKMDLFYGVHIKYDWADTITWKENRRR